VFWGHLLANERVGEEELVYTRPADLFPSSGINLKEKKGFHNNLW